MRDAAPQGTYKVQALDRAFAVLDLLGESETPLGLAQVAASLQLHKSTAHRFLMVLERHRMVERTGNGKFRLGLRLFDFGNRAIEQYDLRDRAQPHLRRLVAETEETAHLALLEAARVIYIDKIEPTRSVRMITRIGASNPVHCTSVGKAMLAFLPPERANEVLRLHERTEHVVTEELSPAPAQPSHPVQIQLFEPLNYGIAERIRNLKIDELRPIEALRLLAELQDELRRQCV